MTAAGSYGGRQTHRFDLRAAVFNHLASRILSDLSHVCVSTDHLRYVYVRLAVILCLSLNVFIYIENVLK